MHNRKALVTGASSGIGLVFARKLAQEGFQVTVVARNEEKLAKLTNELGTGHRSIRADLTRPDDIALIVQDLEETRYQLLINNAGYGIYEKFENIPLEQINNLLQLNINTLVQLSHVYIKNASAGDALINVSSVLSLLPYPGGAVYSGSKGFVTNFTEALWYECRDRDIYVMALLPGVTETNFHTVAIADTGKGGPGRPGYPPEVVVDEAMAALKARTKPTQISGPRFRYLAAAATRLLSRKKIIEIMGRESPGMQ